MKYKFYVCLLLAMLSGLHVMAFDFEVDGIYYNTTGSKTVSVTSGTYAYEGDIVVPQKLTWSGDTYFVTAVEGTAFTSCSALNSVVLPEGVTLIEASAFKNSSIKSVTLPSTLTSLGNEAFRNCGNLTGIVLPDALEVIKENAFYQCPNLRTMTLGSQTVSIERYAFYQTPIEEVIIPSKVKTIGQYAFSNCAKLKSVVIDNAPVFIDNCAFKGCTSLETLDLGNAVIGFGYYYESRYGGSGAFQECTSLTKVVIPASVTEINWTFMGCSRLHDVTLPNSLGIIGSHAFYGTAITEIEIPSSVKSILEDAFYGCPLNAVQLPEGLKEIGFQAFYGAPLSAVLIPQSVITIGFEAFAFCKNLRSLKIDNAEVNISGSFHDCTMLEDVDLGNNVISLGYGQQGGSWAKGSFWGCSSLKKIILPNSLIDIGAYSFQNCSQLTEIKFPDNIAKIGEYCFADCNKLKNVKLPSSLQKIGNHAFYGCSLLQSIILPTSLTSIDYCAFLGCISLKDILIPEQVTALGNDAFSGCTNLETVVFDNSVVAIGNHAFVDCANLKNVELGKVTSIGTRAFWNCTQLETIQIPNTVESLSGSFEGCTNLKKVVVGSGLKALNEGVFSGCTKLVDVKINSKVLSTVGNYTFYNCRSLKKIELPASVTSIGQQAFAGCSELANIYMNPTTPPTINVNTFSDYDTPTLHVPASAKTDYTKADNWKQFTKVIAIGTEPKATEAEIDALEALVNSAQTLYNNAVEGTEAGNYRTGAKAALLAAIKEVRDRIADDMTTEDVEDCTGIINAAVKSFNAKQISNETQTDNTLRFATNLKASSGAVFELPVELNNKDAISALQFDLYLPEGMNLAEDEYGDCLIDLSRTTAKRHSVASQKMASGALRVVISSTTNATFSGNSGAVATLSLFPAQSMEPGDYDVTLKNIVLTDPQAKRYVAPDITSIINISDYTMGDVNNDGFVDVADLAGVVRFILETADASLVFNAADMDGNGIVEVNDYAALVNLILSQSAGSKAFKSRGFDHCLPTLLSMSPVTLQPGGESELVIRLADKAKAYTGLQFDLRLPEGVSIAEDGAEAAGAHHGAWSMYHAEDGTYRVLCASASNAELSRGEVLRLRLKAENAGQGTYDVTATNVVLSDVKADRYEAAAMQALLNIGNVTGIPALCAQGLEVSVGKGFVIISSDKAQQLYIVNTAGVMVENVALTAGETRTFNLPAGIYIINNVKIAIK